MSCESCPHLPVRIIATGYDTDVAAWLEEAERYGVTITHEESRPDECKRECEWRPNDE